MIWGVLFAALCSAATGDLSSWTMAGQHNALCVFFLDQATFKDMWQDTNKVSSLTLGECVVWACK